VLQLTLVTRRAETGLKIGVNLRSKTFEFGVAPSLPAKHRACFRLQAVEVGDAVDLSAL
jgi:hypothetical protein